LKAAVIHAKDDTDKIKTLLSFALERDNSNPDTSLLLGNQALALSGKIDWKKGIINALFEIGLFTELEGNLTTASVFEDSALSLSNKYNCLENLSSIYNELGNITSEQNSYTIGLDYYFKALALDSITDKRLIPAVCNNIGLNYQEMGNYVKAEEYYLKTEKIYEDANKAEHLGVIYGNLGNLYYVEGNYQKGLDNNFKAMRADSSKGNLRGLIPDYQNIGLGFLDMKNYTNSLIYTFKGITLSKKIGEISNIQRGLVNVAENYIKIYQSDSADKGFTYMTGPEKSYISHVALLDSALIYEQSSMRYANAVSDKLTMITAMRGIGDVFVLRKNFNAAISCYQRAYSIADSLGVLQQQLDFSDVLGHTYAKAGDYQSAIKYLDKSNMLKDSIFSIEKNKQITEMEAKYQSEKKEKEIEALSQKNQIQNLQIRQNEYFIIGLSFLALLTAVIAFLLIRQNRINTLSAKIELEQKLLRSQMNPHFIFNAMTSIQNYIYKEEPQEAANYLSSVFKLMRSILESSKQEYIVLEKEISTLTYYLTLQQICFHNKFDFTITTGPGIDIENTLIPPMMAQPIIENAIEHGIVNKTDEKGKISIRLALHGDMFSFEIEDNGVGRDKAREISLQHSSEHLSVATNITQERIDLLNKKSKKKISMQIIDLKNEHNEACGTKVIFFFPLNTVV